MQYPFDNQTLIRLLQGDPQGRELALKKIFLDETLRAQTAKVVASFGAADNLRDDIFSETLICFERGIRRNQFDGQSHWRTWFIAIAKWGYLARQRRERKIVLQPEVVTSDEELHLSPEDIFLESERRNALEAALAKLGEKCRQIIEMYRLHHSMEEIAAARNYANANVAKKEASLCRERLRHLLLNLAETKEIFTMAK